MVTYIMYVLLVALTLPAGILLTITDEFLGIKALSSVYSENSINIEENIRRLVRIYVNML